MKYKCPLLVVTDMEKSKAFYRDVLGLRVTTDLGANVTLTGGLALQTLDSWREFIGAGESDIRFDGRDAEIYFEEDDFDGFVERLKSLPELRYVHPTKEHAWGQRVVRFCDPDMHIIEVGENLVTVCKRFLNGGMTPEQTAERMGMPLRFVTDCMR